MSSQNSRQNLIEGLTRALREVTCTSVLVSEAMAGKLGINGTDLECLDFLLLHGPLTAGMIAQRSRLTTGAVTGVVDRLQRANLVRRTRDRNDRRKLKIAASRDADSQVRLIAAPVKRAMVAVVKGYSDDNLVMLLDFIARIHTGLQEAITEIGGSTSVYRHEVGSVQLDG